MLLVPSIINIAFTNLWVLEGLLTGPQVQPLPGPAPRRERVLWMTSVLHGRPLPLPQKSTYPSCAWPFPRVPTLLSGYPGSSLPYRRVCLSRVSFATSGPGGVAPPCESPLSPSGLVGSGGKSTILCCPGHTPASFKGTAAFSVEFSSCPTAWNFTTRSEG